jgi:hypothetical protein
MNPEDKFLILHNIASLQENDSLHVEYILEAKTAGKRSDRETEMETEMETEAEPKRRQTKRQRK